MKALLSGIYLVIAPKINLYLTDAYNPALTFNGSTGAVNQDWLTYPYQGGTIFQNVRTGRFINCGAQAGALCQGSNTPQVLQPILVSGTRSFVIKTPDNLYLHRTTDNQLGVITQDPLKYTALLTLIQIQIG